jgi:hypothetical protein
VVRQRFDGAACEDAGEDAGDPSAELRISGKLRRDLGGAGEV